MKIRRVLLTVMATGALLGAGAAPAFAAGPRVPAGCSFDQATGVLTCVSTTTSDSTLGPFTSGGWVPAAETYGGFSGTQVCGGLGIRNTVQWGLDNLVFRVAVKTTTTTERHGLNGEVFSTVTSAPVVSLLGLGTGTLECSQS
jgi:hypothetical protein